MTVKRRFLKQNRELALNNSRQNIRIGSLEAEVSRLVAENVAWREESIRLAEEVRKRNMIMMYKSEVQAVKKEMDQKLAEMTKLAERLAELAKITINRDRASNKLASMGLASFESSRVKDDWDMAMQEQEGKLPIIDEEESEISFNSGNSKMSMITVNGLGSMDISESPDLGPPPVAHFEVSDPIRFDHSPTPSSEFDEIPINEEDEKVETVNMTSNLEKRRKRRTSSLLEDMASQEGAATVTEAPQPSPSKPYGTPEEIAEALRGVEEDLAKAKSPVEAASAAIARKALAWRKRGADLELQELRAKTELTPAKEHMEKARKMGPTSEDLKEKLWRPLPTREKKDTSQMPIKEVLAQPLPGKTAKELRAKLEASPPLEERFAKWDESVLKMQEGSASASEEGPAQAPSPTKSA